jgi:hypothetical protein
VYAPLANNTTLAEGERVHTGANGFVTLELADGTHEPAARQPARVEDAASHRADGMLDRVFELTRGEVDSEVTHLKKRDDRFQIRSPSVVAGVRGRTRVNYDADGNAATRVEVLDGTVGVAGKQQLADATLVHADFGSVATSSGTVGAPIPLLPAPALAHPDKVQDEPDIAFDVVPLEHANAYHLQLGRDAGMLDLFSETRTVSTRAVFREVPNGTYFVRVAAIDDNGLEGTPHLRVRAAPMGLDASASPGPTGMSSAGGRRLRRRRALSLRAVALEGSERTRGRRDGPAARADQRRAPAAGRLLLGRDGRGVRRRQVLSRRPVRSARSPCRADPRHETRLRFSTAALSAAAS